MVRIETKNLIEFNMICNSLIPLFHLFDTILRFDTYHAFNRKNERERTERCCEVMLLYLSHQIQHGLKFSHSTYSIRHCVLNMAVLRSGKNTVIKKNNLKPKKSRRGKLTELHKYKITECTIKLERLTKVEINKYLSNSLASQYSLRQRNVSKTIPNIPKLSNVDEKRLVKVSQSNLIWRELSSLNSCVFHPTEIVLAKMDSFRPWPARINSVFKVGNVVKCYVMFYGTLQIGSVLKSQCVRINECDLYLFHAVQEIKNKFKWNLDYESLSKTDDVERAIALQKLTQVQKFLLALREIELIRKIPLKQSMVQG